MFLALHISPCKHSPWCLPLCSAHIFVTRVSKQGRPQKCWLLQAPIQHSRNWIELHLWFQLEMDQGLNLVIKQALCFWKALPWSGIYSGWRVREGRGAGLALPRTQWVLLSWLSRFPIAMSTSTPLWNWAVLSADKQIPFPPPHGSLHTAHIYPLVSIEVLISLAVKTGINSEEVRWRLRWPQIERLMETTKQQHTGLQTGQ